MVQPQLKTVSLAHTSPALKVHLALYRDLKNSRFLRKQLIEQNKAFEYAFIDARKIISTTHVLAAVFRAVNDQANDRLKSHNVHSEIVLSLNTTNNIGDGLRKFGISDQTTTLVVVKVSSEDVEVTQSQLADAIEGEPLKFDDAELAKLHDLNDIRKIYKLSSPGGGEGKGRSKGRGAEASSSQPMGAPAQELADLEMAILGSMALRGAT